MKGHLKLHDLSRGSCKSQDRTYATATVDVQQLGVAQVAIAERLASFY